MRPEPGQLPTSLPSPHRIQWRWIVAGAVLIAVIVGIWLFRHSTAETELPKPADKKEAVVFELADTDVATIAARELHVNLPISGSLIPQNNITVKSKVTAVVSETTVQEGDSVIEGQVLARFDNADLSARLETQEAAVEESNTKLVLAKKNRESSYALFKQNYISQNAFDTSENALELAQANLKSTISQREVARLALADTVVHAPMQGVISKRLVQAGEKVSPDTPLFSLVNLTKLNLEAQVPASEIPRVKIGQTVSFSVDGFAGREFVGNVVRINPNVENGTRSFMVYVEVNNRDGALRGGMFAKGQLSLQKTSKTSIVPLIAVHQLNGVTTVYKIEQNRVVAQTVKLGLRNDDEGYAEVKDGLTVGEQVIISQLNMVKPGSKVSLPEHKASSGSKG
ncbi:efflux RND transporter periplasmic adaptor subunit [Solimicrobium silvestre]|uniref:Efflux transporter, RND family, MFP subunit n=1 Tax=Solimicrobium silvestre TaxID=2099400 RepID=A0A2S9H506_9BURK|nr:efflux RND transporter periplasmic adaptor subunit [Solimicrobium silvestre]PRC95048.1 Efflux transporter, RND family, MFP subunit [Solimicrobium silvestre]